MRRICYITGTRADFGLMQATLEAIHADPGLSLGILATGMHLDPAYGLTIEEIRATGLPIAGEAPVSLTPATGATMARGIGVMLNGFVDHLERERPDLVLLLGDRGEMLAGALAAIHLNIPVAHIHGGERSGTVDEPIRHAVSKLSHLHLTTTAAARERLIRMGEREDRVFVCGAPGIDRLAETPRPSREAICADYGFDPSAPLALLAMHPVLQDADRAGDDAALLTERLLNAGLQVVAVMPNSDAGSDGIRAAMAAARDQRGLVIETHLPRERFVACMAAADIFAGNSSSGIIEAGTFGTPVINVGSRQRLRERNANVIDIDCTPQAIDDAVAAALAHGRFAPVNIYGDGRAAERIVAVLRDTPLDAELMRKINVY